MKEWQVLTLWWSWDIHLLLPSDISSSGSWPSDSDQDLYIGPFNSHTSGSDPTYTITSPVLRPLGWDWTTPPAFLQLADSRLYTFFRNIDIFRNTKFRTISISVSLENLYREPWLIQQGSRPTGTIQLKNDSKVQCCLNRTLPNSEFYFCTLSC